MDIDGKTIKRWTMCQGGSLCLFFTDGTHQIITAYHDTTSGSDIQFIDDEDLELYETWRLEIITSAEFYKRQDAQRQRDIEAREASDRERYEYLKAKFEGKD
jgi:hypothetical protein